MLNIITFIITKLEQRLSKKEECLYKNKITNEKLKLYRKLLNEIDKYNYRIKKISTFRHYRYKTFKVDKGE